MDDLSNILSRIVDFAASNMFIVFIVLGLIASARRSRRNKGNPMPLPNPNTPSRTESKQAAQTLFPAPTQGDVITSSPTSFTTVTPPSVVEERPDDMMKDLVKRVG